MIERQTGRKIKIVRSDNGGEYVNKRFNDHFNKCGIKRQLTVPYTPQQNGVAERANRTLVEMARSMLAYSGLGENLWAEAISTAVYIRNRSPTSLIKDVTPFEMFTGRKPCVSHFRVFGSTAVALDKTQRKKLQPKGREFKMVGYSLTSKAYRLFDVNTEDIVERRDVYFDESEKSDNLADNNEVLIDLNGESTLANDCEGDNSSDKQEEENNTSEYESIDEMQSEEEPQQIIRRGRPKIVRTGKPGRPRKVYNTLNRLQGVANIEVPNSVAEAVNSEYKNEWKKAMKIEYDSLIKNKTWTLVDLPDGQKAIGSKWVFSIKKNKNGIIEKFKARLVAKGCSQKFGIDYKETFSPVIRYATIRMLLALSVEHDLYLEQMDVCSAYLNSDLHDVVYMQQPDCFINGDYPKRVLRLNKAIYGLKQSGREWNNKLDEVLRSMNFKSLENEKCLYKYNGKDKVIFIAVYVDDIIIASRSKDDILNVKTEIFEHFDCVDKGRLSYFLGIEIERNGDLGEISIGQRKYIENLLSENNMEQCRKVCIPLDAGFQVKCEKESCEKVNATEYQSLIGSLMYLALSTRPDILHSVSKLAQCNTNPL